MSNMWGSVCCSACLHPSDELFKACTKNVMRICACSGHKGLTLTYVWDLDLTTGTKLSSFVARNVLHNSIQISNSLVGGVETTPTSTQVPKSVLLTLALRTFNGRSTDLCHRYQYQIIPPEIPIIRVPRKEVGKRSSITFFRLWDSFGHFFWRLILSLFPSLFCQTPFAGLLLRQCETNSHEILAR